jgi:iron complex outermembrane receptor protein
VQFASASFVPALFVVLTTPLAVCAQTGEAIEEITVRGERLDAEAPDAGTMPKPVAASTSDTASLLRNMAGVSLQQAGGVSSLPAIHGLADDRVRIKVNGMDLVSACPNHMNPALSYIDPVNVDDVEVFAGITPVSVGGDSIGGTIIVDAREPEFAEPGGEMRLSGRLESFYRSESSGGNVSVDVGGESVAVRYNLAMANANDHAAAGKFKSGGAAAVDRGWLAGSTVGSSYYDTTNQSLGLAFKRDNQLFLLQVTDQHITGQGFPNQRMDMTDNQGHSYNLRHVATFTWGTLESRVYHEQTRHRMNFGHDKQYWYGDAPGMPMNTDGKNTGGSIAANVQFGASNVLRTGLEMQTYALDDWWPPSGTGPMMSPNTFWNIHNGERDRYGAFVEWQRSWAHRWTASMGLRSDIVRMNTGNVQGYSDTDGMGMMTTQYLTESTAFNERDHSRTDYNVDATVLARYTADDAHSFEIGYARKTRSPNLYERFAWSTSGMVMRMVNFAGDGNGYVGNLDLDPEVAQTLGAAADWRDAGSDRWGVRIAPYLTYVHDYIDVRRCVSANPNCGAANHTATDAFVYLQFVNQNARLYGVDVTAHVALAASPRYGTFTLNGVFGYVDGNNRTTGDDLYNVMPLSLKLALEHKLGGWTNVVETQFAGAKTNVSQVRNELSTDSYRLVNVRSSYAWGRVNVDVGIDNLFNEHYDLPLGGAYVGQGPTMTATGVPYGIAVPGAGLSLYAGLSVVI